MSDNSVAVLLPVLGKVYCILPALSTSLAVAAAGHLHWLSFLAFALSVVFEGVRMVLTEKLLGQASKGHAARVQCNFTASVSDEPSPPVSCVEPSLVGLAAQAKYNVMEALVYLGPFTFAFLAAGAYVFEWHNGLSTTVRRRPLRESA
jgi:hypothetical protein